MIPFVSLLIMNSIIIYTVRERSKGNLSESIGQGQTEGQLMKVKNPESQITNTLLLITIFILNSKHSSRFPDILSDLNQWRFSQILRGFVFSATNRKERVLYQPLYQLLPLRDLRSEIQNRFKETVCL